MSPAERHVYSIPAGIGFLDALAAGLLAETSGDPLALAGYRILLPTRRACRALQEAFLRQNCFYFDSVLAARPGAPGESAGRRASPS